MTHNMNVFVVLVVVCAAFTRGETTNLCSELELDKCIEKLSVDAFGKDTIPDLSEQDLQRTCNDWRDSQGCMELLKEACEASPNTTDPSVRGHVIHTIEELNDGHSFMCDEQFSLVYLGDVRSCLEEHKDEIQAVGKSCMEAYHSSSWFLNKSDPINRYQFCSSANTYLGCQISQAKGICGDKSADWVDKYHRRLWATHLNQIDCKPESGVESGAIVIMTLCVGATIYCVLLIVLGFVKESKKCQCSPTKVRRKGEYTEQAQEAD